MEECPATKRAGIWELWRKAGFDKKAAEELMSYCDSSVNPKGDP